MLLFAQPRLKLRSRLFTTCNLDNIDHDPTSALAHSSSHGTAISLSQHCSNEIRRLPRHTDGHLVVIDKHRPKAIKLLPEVFGDTM